jgi:hypothetical protein
MNDSEKVNAVYSKLIDIFDAKEFIYAKEYIDLSFNAYGHLLKIKIIKDGAMSDLIQETEEVLLECNQAINSLGARGVDRFYREVKEKYSFIFDDFSDISLFFKEKINAYKKVLSSICFNAKSSDEKISITANADMQKIEITLKEGDISPHQYIRSFADAYHHLSIILYQFHNEIIEILQDDNMTETAITNLMFTRGVQL